MKEDKGHNSTLPYYKTIPLLHIPYLACILGIKCPNNEIRMYIKFYQENEIVLKNSKLQNKKFSNKQWLVVCWAFRCILCTL